MKSVWVWQKYPIHLQRTKIKFYVDNFLFFRGKFEEEKDFKAARHDVHTLRQKNQSLDTATS